MELPLGERAVLSLLRMGAEREPLYLFVESRIGLPLSPELAAWIEALEALRNHLAWLVRLEAPPHLWEPAEKRLEASSLTLHEAYILLQSDAPPLLSEAHRRLWPGDSLCPAPARRFVVLGQVETIALVKGVTNSILGTLTRSLLWLGWSPELGELCLRLRKELEESIRELEGVRQAPGGKRHIVVMFPTVNNIFNVYKMTCRVVDALCEGIHRRYQ